ncbi:MAG TPA: copper resistance system multicopper oxidase [Pseudomonadales bacterium]|nr:copper resistance system multicopper oxidase [Pseudomonadales bacterium]
MRNKTDNSTVQVNSQRRTFVKGAAVASALAGMGFSPSTLFAAVAKGSGQITPMERPRELRGTEFFLEIGESIVNFTGEPQIAKTVNNMLPSPTLVWREGDEVTIHVKNNLKEDTSLHWHGMILPFEMDGVPGFGFDGIKPGETFTYRFKVQQHGTYWYHSHSGFQRPEGMFGAILIEPKIPDPYEYQRDYIIQLADWSDEDPHDILRHLKLMPDYYNYKQRTVGDFIDEASEKGLRRALADRKMWNEMSMMDRDLSDVTGDTYTFLMNGHTPASHWRGLYTPGEKIRLRFINTGSMTFYDIHMPGLTMTVIAADGNLIQPVEVDQLRIAVAETYDVLIEPKDGQAYAVFAQAIDRSGYAIGSITTREDDLAPTPPMDPLPILTHADMGHGMDHSGHGSMNHSGHGSMDHSGHGSMDHSGHSSMDHSGHGSMDHSVHGSMDHSAHGSMDHSGHGSMDHSTMNHASMDHSAHGSMDHSTMNHGSMDHSGHIMGAMLMPDANREVADWPVEMAEVRWGPNTNMQVTDAQYRLNDPGVGLRDNGRRVLTYADLKNLYPTNRAPKPDREIVLNLTGNMERYLWSIDGVPFSEAEPLYFKYGERLRITFINHTMMTHPMHLHGMWSEVETGDNNYLPKKHVVNVQSGSRISIRVNVDAKGHWAFHCHMLYHMGGMFRRVIVA